MTEISIFLLPMPETGSLCLSLVFSMGIKVDLELGAKWEMCYVSYQNNFFSVKAWSMRMRMTPTIKK